MAVFYEDNKVSGCIRVTNYTDRIKVYTALIIHSS